MAISATSSIFPGPGFAAYLLSQLFFLDKLAAAPLYELDLVGLFRDAPDEALPVASSLLAYNLGIAMERIPMTAFRTFGLDYRPVSAAAPASRPTPVDALQQA